MFKQIIQRKLNEKYLFINKELSLIKEKNFLKELENSLKESNITNKIEMENEIDNVFNQILLRYREISRLLQIDYQLSSNIFYKLFQELKKNNFKEFDKNMKILKMKNKINVKRSKFN